MTTEATDHPGGYQGAIDEFYAEAADRLAAHLDAGRDVVVLCEGDPFFYGSYMHLHKRLGRPLSAEVVPGVTSVSAAAAALGRPLVERDETLTVLPGTLPATSSPPAWPAPTPPRCMKLGRTFTGVRDALGRRRPPATRPGTWSGPPAPGSRTRRCADVDPGHRPVLLARAAAEPRPPPPARPGAARRPR